MSSDAKYYSHIDGLRAIAVLAVFAYHLNSSWMPAGFIGVDIFFVISGFVVSASVMRFEGGFRQFLGFFYARRFIRILPALLASLWVTTMLTVLFIPHAWLSWSNVEVARAAHIGIANFALFKDQTSYFSPRAEFNPFTHTWSLGVEEQFYVIFPFLFFLWLKRPSLRTLIPSLLVGLGALSLVFALYEPNSARAFYLPIFRFWELSLGVVVYQLSQRPRFQHLNSRLNISHLKTFLGFGLIGLVAIGLIIPPQSDFPSLWTIIAVFATAFLMFFFEDGSGGVVKAGLSSRPMRFFGRLSYSLYLFHWPVIVLLRWTIGTNSPLSWSLALIFSFGFTLISYFYIETPFRRFKARTTLSNGRLILASLVLIFISSKMTKWVFHEQSSLSLSVTGKHQDDWYPDKMPVGDAHCEIDSGLKDSVWYFLRGPNCPTLSSSRQMFVIGDSHAGAYMAFYKKLAFEKGIPIRMYTQGGCGFVDFFQPLQNHRPDCIAYIKTSTEDILARAKPGDVLFLPALRLKRFGDQWEVNDNTDNPLMTAEARQLRDAAVQSAPDELAPFLKAGLRVIFEAPKPIFRIPTFRCADWFNATNPVCRYGFSMNRTELLEYRAPVVEAMQRVQTQAQKQIQIWDPFETLCPPNTSNTCEIFRDGKPLFFDTDHLSGFGNLVLYDSFAQTLERN